MHTWRYVSEAIAACSWAVPEYWGGVRRSGAVDRGQDPDGSDTRSDTGLSSRAARALGSACAMPCDGGASGSALVCVVCG